LVAVVDTQIVTKLATNELMVWAIDDATGEPVPDVEVAVAGPDVQAWTTITTDADGLATIPVPRPSEVSNVAREYAVEIASGGRFGAARTEWSTGSEPWVLNVPLSYFDQVHVAHVYTDRPIYRSGENVRYKII